MGTDVKYRVRKIWFNDDGARYDLDQLDSPTINDIASFAAKSVMDVTGISMSGRARTAIYALVRYEVVAHCWGSRWTTRHAADVFAETTNTLSSSSMVARNILDELTDTQLVRREPKIDNPTDGISYRVNYPFIADKCKVEFIPEPYNKEVSDGAKV